MANRQSIPGINTNVNSVLVSSKMQAANMQSPWRQPDVGGLMQGIAKVAGQYYEAEKEAAFKRLDLEADKFQYEELEEIRMATSNEQIPQIEQNFQARVNEAFSQDSWGQKWLKERSELYFAANGRDVMRHGLAKQHELGVLELNKTIGAWTDNISGSAPDKAKVLIGDMNSFIDASPILSPEEKQKTKENALKMALQRQIGANPATALTMLSDDSYKWGEAGIDVNQYKESALASAKDAGKRRIINQINANHAAATELINLSSERRLSLDEINARVPESSADLRQLLYHMNGYSKSDIENGGIKLTEEQKAETAAGIYNTLALLRSNPKATIEDWQNLENDIYRAMTVKAMPLKEGKGLLDDIAAPYMESYQNETSGYDNSSWGGDDVGYAAINTYIDEFVLPNQPDEDDFKGNKALYKKIKAQNDRTRVKIYQTYNAELLKSIAAYNQEYPDAGITIANLNNQLDGVKNKIYNQASAETIRTYNEVNYTRLRALKPEDQPNGVLDGGFIFRNNNSFSRSKDGIPVTQGEFTAVTKKGLFHYGLTPTGEVKKITYAKYREFGGK